MGIGTWGLSGDAYGPVEDLEKVLVRAVDTGLTLFDTADSYGGGAMESLAGQILSKHPKRDELVLVTKIGTDRTTNPPRKRFDAEYIRERVELSRKRTKRDVLPICLLHNPSLDAV